MNDSDFELYLSAWWIYYSRANLVKIGHSSKNILAIMEEHGGEIIPSTAGEDDYEEPDYYQEIGAAYQSLCDLRPTEATALRKNLSSSFTTNKRAAFEMNISRQTYAMYLISAKNYIKNQITKT